MRPKTMRALRAQRGLCGLMLRIVVNRTPMVTPSNVCRDREIGRARHPWAEQQALSTKTPSCRARHRARGHRLVLARDAQGVPTLIGRTRADVASGPWAICMRRKRFFQMDLQRRRAAGRTLGVGGAGRPGEGQSLPLAPLSPPRSRSLSRRRFGHDGRAPTSWADGSKGWNGYLALEEAPIIYNPESQRIWTATLCSGRSR